MGPRGDGRRNTRGDEVHPRAVRLHRGSAHGSGSAWVGSVPEGTLGSGAGPGAGYGASGKIRGRDETGHWSGAAAAGASCGMLATGKSFTGDVIVVRRLPGISLRQLKRPDAEAGSGSLPQAVEEQEEEGRDKGVDKCRDPQMASEPRLRLREQHALRQSDEALVHDEEHRG